MKINRKSFPKQEIQKDLVKESLSTRLFIAGTVPITGRSIVNYSIQLFPDVETKKLVSYMNNKDYLDLACGINHKYPKSLLCQLNNKKKRHGLDIHGKNEKMNHIHYYKGDAFKTPFHNNSYDCITINNYMYFWETKSEDLLKLFKELHRICKKDGEVRIFPVFFGNYSLDNIELYDYLNEHFSIQCLRPKKDYSNESAMCIKNDEIIQLPKNSGSTEYRENHNLMSTCLVIKKL